MHPDVRAFFDPATATVTYLVSDPATKRGAIIDPVLDYDPVAGRISTGGADAVLAAAKADGVAIDWLLETHAHADHLTAADHLKRNTGAKVGIGSRITEVQRQFAPLFNLAEPGREAFDAGFEEGQRFAIGTLEARVLHTPGHTPACVTYVIGDAAFVGDTLFMPDYGTARTDFPGGEAHALYRSIRRILALPDDTRIFVGHDYLPSGRTQPAWESTVADQRAHNVHVHDGVDEAAFVALRQARDATLKPPLLILPSLQVNIRGGALPAPESNGVSYLKTPINRLGAAAA